MGPIIQVAGSVAVHILHCLHVPTSAIALAQPCASPCLTAFCNLVLSRTMTSQLLHCLCEKHCTNMALYLQPLTLQAAWLLHMH